MTSNYKSELRPHHLLESHLQNRSISDLPTIPTLRYCHDPALPPPD